MSLSKLVLEVIVPKFVDELRWCSVLFSAFKKNISVFSVFKNCFLVIYWKLFLKTEPNATICFLKLFSVFKNEKQFFSYEAKHTHNFYSGKKDPCYSFRIYVMSNTRLHPLFVWNHETQYRKLEKTCLQDHFTFFLIKNVKPIFYIIFTEPIFFILNIKCRTKLRINIIFVFHIFGFCKIIILDILIFIYLCQLFWVRKDIIFHIFGFCKIIILDVLIYIFFSGSAKTYYNSLVFNYINLIRFCTNLFVVI